MHANNNNNKSFIERFTHLCDKLEIDTDNLKQNKTLQQFKKFVLGKNVLSKDFSLSKKELSNLIEDLIESLKKNKDKEEIKKLKEKIDKLKGETETKFIEYKNDLIKYLIESLKKNKDKEEIKKLKEKIDKLKGETIRDRLKQTKSNNQRLSSFLKYNKLINTVNESCIKSGVKPFQTYNIKEKTVHSKNQKNNQNIPEHKNSICCKGKELKFKLKTISKKEEQGVQTMLKLKKKSARRTFPMRLRGSKSSLEPIKEEYIEPNLTHKTANISSKNNKKLKQIKEYMAMYNDDQSKKPFEYVLENFQQINNTSEKLINKVNESIHNLYSLLQERRNSLLTQSIANITYDYLMDNKITTDKNEEIITNPHYQSLYLTYNDINNNLSSQTLFAQLVIDLLTKIQKKLNEQDINNKAEEEEEKEIKNLINIDNNQQINK